MRNIIIAFILGFLIASMPVIAGKVNFAVDQTKADIKVEKEKHKDKPWKTLSNTSKDRILFLLAKDAGCVPDDMLYE